jgi:hypothetical protein
MILVEHLDKNSFSNGKARAVIKSVVSTARRMMISAYTRLSPWILQISEVDWVSRMTINVP